MDSEKKEKIIIYVAIGIVAVIILFVLVMIWKNYIVTQKYKAINKYDSTVTYENTMKEYYTKFLSENLKINNFDNLINYISEDYLKNNNLIDKDNEAIKYYLRDEGLISTKITITSVTYTTDGINNYFRFRYEAGNKYKYANIIESAPYNFIVTFEQGDISSLIRNKEVTRKVNEVTYYFKMVEATNSSVTYDVTITNNSENEYTFDFSALNHAQLVYDDVNYANIATSIVSTTDDYSITPGSSKTYRLLYNINAENQFLISGFRFTNVKIGNTEKNQIDIVF